ncbi:DUF4421 family protein [Mangrovimonas aestuarii]|uniref:DUF4421 family protein n=1 Tax=Mangrovimonas aestuarii TaxID=3018443 RepID=UPI00237870F2|nr:DUF4421 family protein [Mangrovimonas aestuarii]
MTSLSVLSQTETEGKGKSFWTVLDTLFIDHDLEKYSARVFTNYKVKQFRIVNREDKFTYIPNNRFGVGFGVANSKAILDIAFNIKNGNKEETHRFDAQGTVIFRNRHYFNGYLQIYNGFNIKNNFDKPDVFRGDIKSRTIGLNYLYTLSDVEFSYSLLKAGFPTRNKDVYITYGYGGFIMFDQFSSSGTIYPETYEDPINIRRYSAGAFGVLAGLLSAFVLPKNFIATCNVLPGIALANEKVTLQNDSYRPSNPLLYKLDVSLGLSYSIKRYYVNLLYETGVYFSDIDYDHKYRFNLSLAKLAIGYKLKV